MEGPAVSHLCQIHKELLACLIAYTNVLLLLLLLLLLFTTIEFSPSGSSPYTSNK